MTALELGATFVGGGAGAVCRYELGRFVGERYSGDFPLGTCVINVSGCFALGLLLTVVTQNTTAGALIASLLGTGFLGGYTTFSTYALEGVLLYLDGGHRVAALALAGPVVAGIVAAAAGAAAGHLVLDAGVAGRLNWLA